MVLGLVLLLAKSDYWVYAGGAERRDIAGGEGDGKKYGGDGAKGYKVGGLDAVEN